jgi:hypothetical protein
VIGLVAVGNALRRLGGKADVGGAVEAALAAGGTDTQRPDLCGSRA